MPPVASLPLENLGQAHATNLLQELARELPSLSPKLQSVARFCLQHASTLHLFRIQDVADACGTIPASVVRLAQRFGLKGFQELKFAFVNQTERHDYHSAKPADPLLQPECLAALQDIDDSALGLASLKGLVSQPEFLHAVHALRAAPHIRFDGAGEEDRLIAAHLQACMRAAGCHPPASPGRTSRSGAWWVQIAVWKEPPQRWTGPATPGARPQVLRLVRGRMNRFASRTREGVEIRVGTDARRMLNALALCEALATAMKPDSLPSHQSPSHQKEPS